MISKILKVLGIVVMLIFFFLISTLTVVDRQPYKDTDFYAEMNQRLDSLKEYWSPGFKDSVFQVGWSKISITPESLQPLAGYGARRPKLMEGVGDSTFVRTTVLVTESSKLAIISADLLIVHPEVKKEVYKKLKGAWSNDELYFSATHTHSGFGGWAPGLVGTLFSGDFSPDIVEFVSDKIVESVKKARSSLSDGAMGYAALSIGDLVYNRLVKDQGTVDPWLKILKFQSLQGTSLNLSFSAHATCLGRRNHLLSGDYPGLLTRELELDNSYTQVAFSAGAVGSMGPFAPNRTDSQRVYHLADGIVEQMRLLDMIGFAADSRPTIRSLKLNIPLRDPNFKVTTNLALRPYVFRLAFGNYIPEIAIVKLDDILMLGLPCDFSGELAVPLYEYAESQNLKLIITSFNGDYIGYVIKDEWYDLEKYEARTMSWYGPDTGAYMSEIIKRIIDAVS